MSLPQLQVPSYFATVPSTKEKVKFRPFLNREEKILLMIKESTDDQEILQSMKDIINVCTFEKLDIDSLALFDLEYIFLQLRAKSVGEVIELSMKCINEVETEDSTPDDMKTKPCDGLIPLMINIKDIEVNFPKEHSKIIMLEKNIGITMRYPSIDDADLLNEEEKSNIEVIIELLDNIFDENNVYEKKDTSIADIEEFIGNINQKQMEDIKNKFFYSIPSLEHTVKYTCSKCGNKGEYTFRGINDFFL